MSGEIKFSATKTETSTAIKRTDLILSRVDDENGKLTGINLKQGFFCVDANGNMLSGFPAGMIDHYYELEMIPASILQAIGIIDKEAETAVSTEVNKVLNTPKQEGTG